MHHQDQTKIGNDDEENGSIFSELRMSSIPGSHFGGNDARLPPPYVNHWSIRMNASIDCSFLESLRMRPVKSVNRNWTDKHVSEPWLFATDLHSRPSRCDHPFNRRTTCTGLVGSSRSTIERSVRSFVDRWFVMNEFFFQKFNHERDQRRQHEPPKSKSSLRSFDYHHYSLVGTPNDKSLGLDSCTKVLCFCLIMFSLPLFVWTRNSKSNRCFSLSFEDHVTR